MLSSDWRQHGRRCLALAVHHPKPAAFEPKVFQIRVSRRDHFLERPEAAANFRILNCRLAQPRLEFRESLRAVLVAPCSLLRALMSRYDGPHQHRWSEG